VLERVLPVSRGRLANVVLGVAIAGTAALVVDRAGAWVGPADSQDRNAKATLTVDMNIGPAQLDPSNNTGLNDTIVGNFYVRLVDLGTKPGPLGTRVVDVNKVRPYLATSWRITDGGRTYTFKLRRGTKFSDGSPVDAKAVKFSFERALTMGLAGAYFLEDGVPGNIRSVAALNSATIVIKLKQPDPNLLQAWAAPPASIVNPAAVKAHGGVEKGKTNEWMASHVAGSGPYLLSSYQPNSRMVLRRNPTFVGTKPAAASVVVNFINSEQTLLLRARTGQADVTVGLTPQSLNSLRGKQGVRIIANGTTLSVWLGFANSQAPFDNVKLRQALASAIPYTDILKNVAYGYGSLYFGPIPPAMPFYAKVTNPYGYNLARAQTLLRESGVSTPVNVSLLVQAGNARDERIATILQGIYRQINVNVSIERLSPTDYINKLLSHKGVQMFLREDGPGVIDPGYYLDYDMRCKIGFNLAEVCIPKADQLLTQARKTTSVAKRRTLYRQITNLWVAQAPKVPIYQIKAAAVVQRGVRGYMFNQIFPDFRPWSTE
jgi:peptide/nickel transport system substrate-binding protein